MNQSRLPPSFQSYAQPLVPTKTFISVFLIVLYGKKIFPAPRDPARAKREVREKDPEKTRTVSQASGNLADSAQQDLSAVFRSSSTKRNKFADKKRFTMFPSEAYRDGRVNADEF
jgi:hypothetical protein